MILIGVFYYQEFNPTAVILTEIEDFFNKKPSENLTLAAAGTEKYQECLDASESIFYQECLPFLGKDT